MIWPENENIHPLRRVKWGIDPTHSRLHLGHLVHLRKLASIAQGREITIVIGTCTARLGDPTGQNATRPVLSEAIVKQNSEAIVAQLRKLCKFQFRLVYNSVFAERASMQDFLHEVSSKFTVNELMERDNFKGRGVGLQELLVPLAQAWDSVCLETQIEVGGQDQMINFSLTRQLQKSMGQRPQTCILMPIINGTDGRKMSKTFDNCIFLDEPEETLKNKLMRISDTVMEEWIPLLVDGVTSADPRVRKEQMTASIISQSLNHKDEVSR